MYAQIIVDVNSRDVDKLFTYAVPEEMELCAGMRVTAPFGPRTLTGMVVSVSDHTDVAVEKIRPLLSRIDDEPVVQPEMMQLAFWMRDTYRTTMAAALRCILPAQVRSGKVRPLTRLAVRLTEEVGAACAKCKRSAKQCELIRLLDGNPDGLLLSEIDMDGAPAVARALEKKGLAEIFVQQVRRVPYIHLEGDLDEFHLSEAQRHAVEAITASLDGETQSFLLHGVTGSGKTEVYLHVVRQALLRGKGAILLVPEIALTPQMVSWFRSRFGDTAAVLHSGLSQGEKYDEWRRIRRGEARVVIGGVCAGEQPWLDPDR